MKKLMIQEKLEELEYPVDSLPLGDFDQIGEYTAKKRREPGSELYNKVGAFFRPNYERGLLIYSLIRRFKIESYLEIGFGRGYGAMCAVKAMVDGGISGKVTVVDPNVTEDQIKQLGQVLPQAWFSYIDFYAGPSDSVFEHLGDKKFEMIYVDGDHRYEQVQRDWENSKSRFTKFVLFDDYHMPDKDEKDIDVARVVDSIEGYDRELIIMDRRIFLDDRGYSDDEINYGQVLVTHPEFDKSEFLMDW